VNEDDRNVNDEVRDPERDERFAGESTEESVEEQVATEPDYPHQNAYVGVSPEPEWVSPPINTEAEVEQLVEVGVLPDPNPEEKTDETDETDETDGPEVEHREDEAGRTDRSDDTVLKTQNPDGSPSTGSAVNRDDEKRDDDKRDDGPFASTLI